MKLTREMRSEYYVAVETVRNRPPGMSVQQWMFLAGYRMGQRDMRERAAKECDAADERAYPFACAARIRALPIEDANG